MHTSIQSNVVGTSIFDLDTPCLLLDYEKLKSNLNRMATVARIAGVSLRPHSKAHKSPKIAQMQIQAGAVGICCAKLSEAEVMDASGVSGLLVTTPIIGDAKIRRAVGLANVGDLTVVLDSEENASEFSEAAAELDVRIKCLVDVNVGQNRGGVEPEQAVALAQSVARKPGLSIVGVQGYEGHIQGIISKEERAVRHLEVMNRLEYAAGGLADAGLPMQIVTTGGTGTAGMAAGHPVVTEIQPGSYAMMDTSYGGVEGVEFENALSVLTTVLTSKPGRVIVDAGMKTLSTDSGPAQPLTTGPESPERYENQGDEHGQLHFLGDFRPKVGEKFLLVPSHCDTTVNLHDEFFVINQGRVAAVWPILGRGRIR